VTGLLTRRSLETPGFAATMRLAFGIFLGTVVIFIGGASQLALLTGDAANAVRVGVLPFVLGDVLKVTAATLIARRLGARARTLF
jgi:biotin transporter BioY